MDFYSRSQGRINTQAGSATIMEKEPQRDTRARQLLYQKPMFGITTALLTSVLQTSMMRREVSGARLIPGTTSTLLCVLCSCLKKLTLTYRASIDGTQMTVIQSSKSVTIPTLFPSRVALSSLATLSSRRQLPVSLSQLQQLWLLFS